MKRKPGSAKKTHDEKPISKKPSSPRSHYLLAEVTPQEKEEIVEYCRAHNLTVSRFLAQVALADAQPRKKANPQESLTVTITLPANKRAKLLYLARLREKSIDQLVEELIAPDLDKNLRGPGSRYTLPTETLRYYLDDEQHALIKQHMEKEQVSSRHYLPQIALQMIEKRSSRRPSKRESFLRK